MGVMMLAKAERCWRSQQSFINSLKLQLPGLVPVNLCFSVVILDCDDVRGTVRTACIDIRVSFFIAIIEKHLAV